MSSANILRSDCPDALIDARNKLEKAKYRTLWDTAFIPNFFVDTFMEKYSIYPVTENFQTILDLYLWYNDLQYEGLKIDPNKYI